MSSISCLAAILDSVVAPSNKEFYFLFALGKIWEVSSISCLVAILKCLLPLATRCCIKSISCQGWWALTASSCFLFCFYVISLVTHSWLSVLEITFPYIYSCQTTGNCSINKLGLSLQNLKFQLSMWGYGCSQLFFSVDSLLTFGICVSCFSICQTIITYYFRSWWWAYHILIFVKLNWCHQFGLDALFRSVYVIYQKYYWIIFKGSIFSFYCLCKFIFKFYCVYLQHCRWICFDYRC